MNKKRMVAIMMVLWSSGLFASAVAAAEPASLSIKELVRRVQTELIASEAERQASKQEPLFEVEKLTIEINFVVTRTTNAKGGFDFKLVTIGGDKTYEDQQGQKITRELKAIPEEKLHEGSKSGRYPVPPR